MRPIESGIVTVRVFCCVVVMAGPAATYILYKRFKVLSLYVSVVAFLLFVAVGAALEIGLWRFR